MNAPTRAIVLSAGRGARLGALTDDMPKSMLPLGETTLLGRQLSQLERSGIRRVTVVGGYRDGVLRGVLADRGGQADVRCVSNADWARTGSAASLIMAKEELTAGESVLLSHGDIVYDDEILERVMEHGGTVVAADRTWVTATGDEVVAWSADGRLAGVVKGSAPARCEDSGEFIGLSVLSAEFARAFAEFCSGRADITRTEDYEQPLLHDYVVSGALAAVSYTDHVPWINVNYAEDLAYAQERFGVRTASN